MSKHLFDERLLVMVEVTNGIELDPKFKQFLNSEIRRNIKEVLDELNQARYEEYYTIEGFTSQIKKDRGIE